MLWGGWADHLPLLSCAEADGWREDQSESMRVPRCGFSLEVVLRSWLWGGGVTGVVLKVKGSSSWSYPGMLDALVGWGGGSISITIRPGAQFLKGAGIQ